MFIERYLSKDIEELALRRNKMAFISGPRQVGKTTLAKLYKSIYDEYAYKNWDESEFRKLWTKSPKLIVSQFHFEKTQSKRLLILDEIHKSIKWKQKIKGLFDEYQDDLNFIITGSARLNIFKRGSDSLLGRYLPFRLHPLSYGEVSRESFKSSAKMDPESWKQSLFKKKISDTLKREPLDRLFAMSGFPEPYFSNSEKILRIWRRGRHEKIVREDLRDLSRLPELSQVEMLTSLLPEKVGNPLSVQSLREDLEVAHDTVTRWMKYLEQLYYFFEIKPWNHSFPRSLRKQGKIYLYDWTHTEEEGPKFENFIACHLIKACHYWTDTGEGDFDLFYLMNKEKQEIDFLIVKNKKPWLMVESKLNNTEMNHKNMNKFIGYFNCPVIQVVFPSDIWRTDLSQKYEKTLMSSDRFLFHLP